MYRTNSACEKAEEASRMAETLLTVKNLVTQFIYDDRKLTAVNDVSFEIHKGETFGLIGESGCGKSVTCRSLIRLVKYPGQITGGRILYQGRDLLKLSEEEMEHVRGSQIGMIFQEPMTTLNPVMTIGDQIMESFKDPDLKRQQKWDRAVELLKFVGIPAPQQRMREYAHQYSGGMRQRAMIAIALASNPHLLLADEPTTALDVTIQDQIIQLLNGLKTKLGMSILLITHDLGVASQICDHIAVMYAGRIMESADTAEIFDHPMNPYTYGLMRAIPSLERKGQELYSIEGTPPALDQMPAGCPFAPRCEFRKEICDKEVPQLQECSPGHLSRCHFCRTFLENRGKDAGTSTSRQLK